MSDNQTLVCTYVVGIFHEDEGYRAKIGEHTPSGKKLPPHLAGETLLEAADAFQRAAEKHYPEVVGEWSRGA